jgi:hypothetical protein
MSVSIVKWKKLKHTRTQGGKRCLLGSDSACRLLLAGYLLGLISTLKKEDVCSIKTKVNFLRTTWRKFPEKSSHLSRSCENTESNTRIYTVPHETSARLQELIIMIVSGEKWYIKMEKNLYSYGDIQQTWGKERDDVLLTNGWAAFGVRGYMIQQLRDSHTPYRIFARSYKFFFFVLPPKKA